MTSKAYVRVQLGNKELVAGALTSSKGLYRFAYSKEWLAHPKAFAIDPINLPLSQKPIGASWLWRCFEDAYPDSWGQRVVLALHSNLQGGLLDTLTFTRGTGGTAMHLTRSATTPPFDARLADFEQLPSLMPIIEGLDDGSLNAHGLDIHDTNRVLQGSYMGGARPKLLVMHEGEQWLAKLPSHQDRFDVMRAEFAFSTIAAECGILMAETRLADVSGKPVLLSKRFDRDGQQRTHYLSAWALLNSNEHNSFLSFRIRSYSEIAQLIRKVSSSPKEDLAELYRRMVFNVLIGNTDDHLKNHGFLYDRKGRYRLSPAFDVVPTLSPLRDQSLLVGKLGTESSIENLLSDTASYGLTETQARDVIVQQTSILKGASAHLEKAGLVEKDRERLLAALNRLLPDQPAAQGSN